MNADSPYAEARAEGEAALRTSILNVASQILADQGANGLTMRRVAEQAGCSTTVLYTLFGGKEGVAEGLFLEGFERLRAAAQTVPQTDDPLRDAYEICCAFRATAKAYPTHYAVMFGRAIPEFTPTEATMARALAALTPLLQTLERAFAYGRLEPQPAKPLAVLLWSAAHGVVSLELIGMLETALADALFETALWNHLNAARTETVSV